MPEPSASAAKSDVWFLRPAAVVAGVILLLFLPFVNKAIHIDDLAFLRTAEMFGWNPLRAFPQDYYYQGGIEKNLLPYESTHPLLIPYLLKILQGLFGAHEIPLHLAFLVFPWLALRSLARLDEALPERQNENRWLLLVLFGALPAFVVNGQNLMTDVPTLAFLLAGTAAVAQVVKGGREGLLWQAACWLSCAVFTSYQAVVFLPVLAAFLLSGGTGRRQVRAIAVLLLPAVILFVWLLLVYGEYGIFPLLQSQAHSSIGGEVSRGLQSPVLRSKLIYICAMTGASLLFVLPLRFRAHALSNGLRHLVVILVTTGLFCLLPAEPESGWGLRFALALLAALGVYGLGLAAREIRNWCRLATSRPAAILCGGWLAMTLLVNLFALPFGSARYLLPLFPVLLLVLLRSESLPQRCSPRFALILACCAVLWGGANAWSDYSYAGTYRSMADEVVQFRQGLGDGQHLWYIGEWGMRHYFDRAGANYLPADSNEPRAGDYLVIPEMPRFWAPAQALRPRLGVYATREWSSPLPLRLFNRSSGAGFYAHHWGMLPFAFSTKPDEVFTIMQVR